MRKLLFVSLLALLVVGLLLSGCSSSPTSAPPPTSSAAASTTSTSASTSPSSAGQAEWELKAILQQPNTNTAYTDGMVPYAQSIEQATHGRVKIDIYGGESVAKLADQADAIQNGIADMGWTVAAMTPGRFPITETLGLPFFGVNTAAQGSLALWGLYEAMPDQFDGPGKEYSQVKLLSFASSGASELHTNKPVRTPADIKGMKIGITGDPVIKTLEAMGAVPVPIGIGDYYTSLQKGVVDGVFVDYLGYTARKLYEVAKYTTEVHLSDTPFPIIMNLNTWNSFPKDVQDEIMSVSGAKAAQTISANVWDAGIKAGRAQIANMQGQTIITLTDQEAQEWQSYAVPIQQQYVQTLNSKGLPGQQIYDTLKAQIAKYAGQ